METGFGELLPVDGAVEEGDVVAASEEFFADFYYGDDVAGPGC